MRFTYLFPDALSIEPSSALPVQTLAKRIFARCRLIQCVDDNAAVPIEMPWEQWLRQQFLLAASASVEAASAFADGINAPCWRLTPVHFHLGRDHVVLTDPTQLELNLPDALTLGESIRGVLRENGLELLIPAPNRWYLVSSDSRLELDRWSERSRLAGTQRQKYRRLQSCRTTRPKLAPPVDRNPDVVARTPNQRAAGHSGASGREQRVAGRTCNASRLECL